MKELTAIALGGNLASRHGRPQTTLLAALGEIGSELGTIHAVSRFFSTPAFPSRESPPFVNAAVLVRTALAPGEVLTALHRIEAGFGRERAERWGARTLDLDLLFVGDRVLPDAGVQSHWRSLAPERQGQEAPDALILPHPRLADRSFVLIPLAEIAPGWRHPLAGQSVSEMLAALPDEAKAEICPV